MKKFLNIILFMLVFSFSVTGQEVDIVPYLKQIESGDIEKAQKSLEELQAMYPHDPSVKFLDAILTRKGVEALRKYIDIYDKYPKSKYADAALYRMYSYYYALGYYKKAENYLEKLKAEYPGSPYIDAVEKNNPGQTGVFYKETNTADNKSEPPKPKVKNKPAEVEANYTVQAGAFLSLKNAENLKKQLESEGYPAKITQKEVGGSVLNVLTAGNFSSTKQTDKLLTLLSKKYKLQGRIISLK